MMVISADKVAPLDVGKILKVPPLEGVTIQWLVHKGVGDERYGHRFAMRIYTLPPGKMFPMHFHKYVEAVYVLSGRASFENEEEVREIGPGDVLYTFSDEPHGGVVIGDEPLRVLCCIDCVDELTCDPMKQAQAVTT